MLGIGAFVLTCATVLGAPNDAVLVYFSSAQCGACRAAEPSVAEFESRGVVVRRVSADREPQLADRYGVRALPTFIVLRGGKEVDRFVGAQAISELQAILFDQDPHRLTDTAVEAAQSQRDPREVSAGVPASAPGLAPLINRSAAASPMGRATNDANSMASAVLRAERATVRLRVYDGKGFGVGTGTIIDTHGEEALILTCGHIFRETDGKGRIEVDLFVGGRTVTLPGQLVDYDAKTRDIGLISIRPGLPVVPAPVAGVSAMPATGQSAFSYGCDLGADPSRRDTRVTAINKFQGPQNVEIKGAPVEGRSGGGLFDQEGRLIGVCNAADHQDDEGLYAGPQVIHWQLDRVALSHLYRDQDGNQRIARNDHSEIQAIPATAVHAPRGAADVIPASMAGSVPPSLAAASTNASNSASADEEVICIIRSRSNPTAEPRVMTISQPSPELMRLLR